jgi:NAD(P)-dependent dehydrogenase (short-subunit alcohol dehydrogenase family)
MSLILKDKNIVIIGGTTGIGFSAAKAFVANGANIVVVGRKAESVADAKKHLGEAAEAFSDDATHPETAIKAITICIKKFGRFDGIYHVAGGSGRKMGDGPLHELTLDGWNKTLELNLTSLMLSNQAAVRQFLTQGAGGSYLETWVQSSAIPRRPSIFQHMLMPPPSQLSLASVNP